MKVPARFAFACGCWILLQHSAGASCSVDQNRLVIRTDEFVAAALPMGRVQLNQLQTGSSGLFRFREFDASTPAEYQDQRRGTAIRYSTPSGLELVLYCNAGGAFEFDWILPDSQVRPAVKWEQQSGASVHPPTLDSIIAYAGKRQIAVETLKDSGWTQFVASGALQDEMVTIDPVVKWAKVLGDTSTSTILKVKQRRNGSLVALKASLYWLGGGFAATENYALLDLDADGNLLRSLPLNLPKGIVPQMEVDANDDIVLVHCPNFVIVPGVCVLGGVLLKIDGGFARGELFRKALPASLGFSSIAIAPSRDIFLFGGGVVEALRDGSIKPSINAIQRAEQGKGDCVLIRYDAAGREMATTILGTNQADGCSAMALTNRNSVVVSLIARQDNRTADPVFAGAPRFQTIGSSDFCNGNRCDHGLGLLFEVNDTFTQVLHAGTLYGLVTPHKIHVTSGGDVIIAGTEELSPQFRVPGSFTSAPEGQFRPPLDVYVGSRNISIVKTNLDFQPATIAIRLWGNPSSEPFESPVANLWTDAGGNIGVHVYANRDSLPVKNALYSDWDHEFYAFSGEPRKRKYYNAVLKFSANGRELLYSTYFPIQPRGELGVRPLASFGPAGSVLPIPGGFLYGGNGGMEINAFPATRILDRTGFIASIDDTRHDLLVGDGQPVEGAGFSGICNGQSVCSIFLPQANGAPKTIAASGSPLPLELDGLFIEGGVGVRVPLYAVIRTPTYTQVNFQAPPPNPRPGAVQAYWAYFEAGGIRVVDQGRAGVFRYNQYRYDQTYCNASPFTHSGTTVAALHGGTGDVVTASNPVRAGGTVSLYATGMEALVSNPPPMGHPALASPLSLSMKLPELFVGGKQAKILFSGLAPGLVGITQINFEVPEGVPSGMAGVRLDYNLPPTGVCPERGVLPVR